eukprot:m.83041 g.83041  ORF g.83041 m.83041 type:complete len:87 (-) comp50800_c0_seq6:1122-1382(-)
MFDNSFVLELVDVRILTAALAGVFGIQHFLFVFVMLLVGPIDSFFVVFVFVILLVGLIDSLFVVFVILLTDLSNFFFVAFAVLSVD